MQRRHNVINCYNLNYSKNIIQVCVYKIVQDHMKYRKYENRIKANNNGPESVSIKIDR